MRRPGPIRAAAAAVGCHAALFLAVPGWSQVTIEAEVDSNSVDNVLLVWVINESGKPAEGVTVGIESAPEGIENMRLTPPEISRLEAGESAEIVFSFDVAADSPTGEREAIKLGFKAEKGLLDKSTAEIMLTVPGPWVTASANKNPLIYRLVRISGPSEEDPGSHTWGFASFKEQCSNDFQSGMAGGTIRCEYGSGRKAAVSLAFTDFPFLITAGQPKIEFAVKVVWKTEYPEGHRCLSKPIPEMGESTRVDCYSGWLHTSFGSWKGYDGMILPNESQTAGPTFEFVLSECIILDQPCQSQKGQERLEGSEPVDISYLYSGQSSQPGRKIRNKRILHSDTIRTDSRGFVVEIDTPLDWHAEETLEDLQDFTSWRALQFSLRTPAGFLTLYYLPTLADSAFLTAATPYEIPPDMYERQERLVAEAEGPGEDAGPGAPGGAATPSGTGVRAAPGTPEVDGNGTFRRPPSAREIDPAQADIARHIAQWIRIAEPPENAQGGNARYTAWGQVVGTVPGNVIRAQGPPDDRGSQSPTEYVWARREQMDSLNHCKLGDYVLAQLAGTSIIHCHGLVPAPIGKLVFDVVDQPGETAKTTLAEQGFDVELALGRPAPSAEREFQVQDQTPAPGYRRPEGSSVTLTLLDKALTAVTIPDIRDIPGAVAERRLLEAGLNPDVQHAVAAPSPEQAFRVFRVEPPVGTETGKNSQVLVVAYGPYDDRVDMPELIGVHVRDAEKELIRLGLNVRTWAEGNAPRVSQSGIVYRQTPSEETVVGPRDEIELIYYDRYIWRGSMPSFVGLSREQVTRALRDLPLKISAEWGDHAPYDSLSETVVSQSVREGASVREGDALELVVYRKSRNQLVAEFDCSSLPNAKSYWNDDQDRPACGCLEGYEPAADLKSCFEPAPRPRVASGATVPPARPPVSRPGTATAGRIDCRALFRKALVAMQREDEFETNRLTGIALESCPGDEVSRSLGEFSVLALTGEHRTTDIDRFLRERGLTPGAGGAETHSLWEEDQQQSLWEDDQAEHRRLQWQREEQRRFQQYQADLARFCSDIYARARQAARGGDDMALSGVFLEHWVALDSGCDPFEVQQVFEPLFFYLPGGGGYQGGRGGFGAGPGTRTGLPLRPASEIPPHLRGRSCGELNQLGYECSVQKGNPYCMLGICLDDDPRQ